MPRCGKLCKKALIPVKQHRSIWMRLLPKPASSKAANNLNADENRASLHTLSEQPLMGKSRNEIHGDIRSFPIDSHIILYFPLENDIDIVRVLGGGQDIESHF